MDMDKSFDSDTSDSWSLIDINDEHLADIDVAEGVDIAEVLTSEASTSETNITENCLSNSCTDDVQNLMQNGTFSNDVNDILNVASSTNNNTKGHQDFQILYKGKVFENDCNLKKKPSEFNCSESSFSDGEKASTEIKDLENDTDGISIISESECNDLKLSADETDDNSDEIPSESNSTEKIQPNVLKRKRKRLKLSYRDSSEESVNGDFKVPDGKYYADVESIDLNKSDDEMRLKEYQNAPVYRHYRNNVANTALSVAMGVIFTGVACIAIGHFLGVHDAQHTAGEMMQTLKRLQMENVLLHTRLAQLSRAFFSRGNNKPTLRHEDEANYLAAYIGSRKTVCDVNENNLNEDNVKNPVLLNGRSVDISSNLNEPADALTYKYVQNGDEFPILREVHDEIKILNFSEENNSETPFSTTTPVNTENVQTNFILSDTIDEKIDSEQHDRTDEEENKDCQVKDVNFQNFNAERLDTLPIEEKDLNIFRRFLLKKKNKIRRSSQVKTEGVSSDYDAEFVYKFPQPEEYYKVNTGESICLATITGKRDVLSSEGDGLISDREQVEKSYLRNSSNHDDKFDKIIPRKKSPKPKKSKPKDDDLSTGECYIHERDSMKKKKMHEKRCPYLSNRATKERKGKYLKKHKNGSSKKLFAAEDCSKEEDGECEVKPNRKVASGNYDSNKKWKSYIKENRSKGATMKDKYPEIDKYTRTYKNKIILRPKKLRTYNVGPSLKPSNESECEECDRKSGNWFYKWAKGRERCRLDQKISDWQFDRAKGREQFRRERDNSDWQFKRAKSRADSRLGDAFWQFSRAMGRETSRMKRKKVKDSFKKGFTSDAYSWI